MNLKEKVKIQEYAEKLRNYQKRTKQAICLKTKHQVIQKILASRFTKVSLVWSDNGIVSYSKYTKKMGGFRNMNKYTLNFEERLL